MDALDNHTHTSLDHLFGCTHRECVALLAPTRASAGTRAASPVEWWITAASKIKRGWLPTPKHARGGRHASPHTRGGRAVLARMYA